MTVILAEGVGLFWYTGPGNEVVGHLHIDIEACSLLARTALLLTLFGPVTVRTGTPHRVYEYKIDVLREFNGLIRTACHKN